jgi:hypothetical protein
LLENGAVWEFLFALFDLMKIGGIGEGLWWLWRLGMKIGSGMRKKEVVVVVWRVEKGC